MQNTGCIWSSLVRSSLLLKCRSSAIVLGIISATYYLLMLLYNNTTSNVHRHDRKQLQNQAISTGKVRIKLPVSQTSADADFANYYEYLTYNLNNPSMATINTLPRNCSDRNDTSFCSFYPTMSVKEAILLRELLVAFVDAADRINVPYFMAYGTLLGAYRHGELIPWDDDLDVMIAERDAGAMLEELRKLAPEYRCVRFAMRLKFASPRGQAKVALHRTSNFTFPNLDIFLYKKSRKKLWDTAYIGWPRVHLTTVFPLVTMPFWGLTLKAPRDTELYFKQLHYNLSICQSNSYDHRYERDIEKPVMVSCSTLYALYPSMIPFNRISSKRTIVDDTVVWPDY